MELKLRFSTNFQARGILHARDTRAQSPTIKNAITAHIQTNIQQWVLHTTYYPAANSKAAYLLRESFSATDGDDRELKNRNNILTKIYKCEIRDC